MYNYKFVLNKFNFQTWNELLKLLINSDPLYFFNFPSKIKMKLVFLKGVYKSLLNIADVNCLSERIYTFLLRFAFQNVSCNFNAGVLFKIHFFTN